MLCVVPPLGLAGTLMFRKLSSLATLTQKNTAGAGGVAEVSLVRFWIVVNYGMSILDCGFWIIEIGFWVLGLWLLEFGIFIFIWGLSFRSRPDF